MTATPLPLDAHSSPAQQVKETLSRCYYLLAQKKMDDRTYTHLSARIPGEKAYYIYPLGMLFEEVTPDKLIKVDFDGNIVEGKETTFNTTGYVIHSSVYKSRPDINAVFHVHTTAGVAVSCMRQGLLPLSQFSLHFYNRLGMHDYNALTLDIDKQGTQLAQDLGPTHKAMILRNHGTMTCGKTSEEALFYMFFLEEACKVQIAALSAGQDNLLLPSKDVCEQAYQGMTAFEKGDVGKRDFEAMCRVTPFPWHTSQESSS